MVSPHCKHMPLSSLSCARCCDTPVPQIGSVAAPDVDAYRAGLAAQQAARQRGGHVVTQGGSGGGCPFAVDGGEAVAAAWARADYTAKAPGRGAADKVCTHACVCTCVCVFMHACVRVHALPECACVHAGGVWGGGSAASESNACRQKSATFLPDLYRRGHRG